MSNRTDVYRAITPLGIVEVDFPEDGGSLMDGDPLAVAYLRDVIGLQTGSLGMTMSPSSLEPDDFVAFCQPLGSGVRIIPPADSLNDEHGPVLDSASGRDRAKIAAEVARKVGELQAATGLQRARIASDLAKAIAADDVSIYNNAISSHHGNAMSNSSSIKVGSEVKFQNPENSDEASERFTVIEHNGDRLLVQFICDMRIKPTFVYLTADMVLA